MSTSGYAYLSHSRSYNKRYFKMLKRMNPRDSFEKPDMQQIGNFLSFASRGDRVGLNLMLRKGLSPNVQDYDLRTALHLAASEGHAPIVELLLHYQADVNLKDRWHRTPLTDARLYGHRDICRILEVNGGKDFYSDQPMTVRQEPEVNEVNIDIAELNPEDSEEYYQGVFGKSEKVKWRGTWVVKTIMNRHIDYPVKMKLLTEDNNRLRELGHPNIVQFLGSTVQAEQMILITEFLPKGNLEEMLNKKLRFDLPTALQYALDFARGMNYLHKHKPLAIVHNHLDPRNLLLDGGDHLKISEYWVHMLYETMSSNEENSQTSVSSTSCSYFRHEMEKDIRSFGFIFYQMIEGRYSRRKTQESDISHLKAINFEPNFQINRCPGRIEQLIKSCTSKEASEKPTFEGVIAILEEFSGSLGRAAWLPRALTHDCAAHYCNLYVE